MARWAAATLLLISAPMALSFAPAGPMLGMRAAKHAKTLPPSRLGPHCGAARGPRPAGPSALQAWTASGGEMIVGGHLAQRRRERGGSLAPIRMSSVGAEDDGKPRGATGWQNAMKDFLSGTSLWICFGIASLVAYEQMVLKLALDFKSIGLTFCHVLVIHKLDRLRDKPTLKSSVGRAFYVGRFNKRTAEKCILAAASVGATTLWLQSDLLVQVIYAFHFLLGITFVSPVLPLALGKSRAGVKAGKAIKTKVALRQIFVMAWKAFIIVMAALFASRADVALLASDAMRVELDSIALFAAAASFTSQNMQDMRDLGEDRITGRQTISSISGAKDTQKIVTFINLAAILGQVAMSVLIGSNMGGLIRPERLFVHLLAIASVWVVPRASLLFSFISEALCAMPLFLIFGLRLVGVSF